MLGVICGLLPLQCHRKQTLTPLSLGKDVDVCVGPTLTNVYGSLVDAIGVSPTADENRDGLE